MTKTSYHHGDLRNSLISAGLKVLREDGLDALSLRRVAREAEVSAAAPYRHFKDKQALLAAISETGFRKLRSMLVAANEDKPGDLDNSGTAYLAFAQQHPEQYRLMFTHNLMCADDVDQELKDSSANAFGALVETIEAGIKNGQIANTCSPNLALASWALIHGIAMLLIDGILGNGPYGELTPEEIRKLCQSYFRNGWKNVS
ncbi:TetR/AcrR family transcriptional regulator [Pelagicoccus mobilis]|uniref:TetR/AcrR family transcriptional regulator n=1 Tax=Pelagicoccus mobilis TaxID=415221 RepID=A0A934VQN5_9BACT|nr:TetR/AcrR family transcriptional regulator [Pelagicoccus mobilis]MBK1876679.1 TetR/AcrR family transcriptional regulator [Pelagicoccus mobilis]